MFSDSTKKVDALPQVSWAEDYLASTSLEGKVQLLKRQDTEDGEQIWRSLKHSLLQMPNLENVFLCLVILREMSA